MQHASRVIFLFVLAVSVLWVASPANAQRFEQFEKKLEEAGKTLDRAIFVLQNLHEEHREYRHDVLNAENSYQRKSFASLLEMIKKEIDAMEPHLRKAMEEYKRAEKALEDAKKEFNREIDEVVCREWDQYKRKPRHKIYVGIDEIVRDYPGFGDNFKRWFYDNPRNNPGDGDYLSENLGNSDYFTPHDSGDSANNKNSGPCPPGQHLSCDPNNPTDCSCVMD